MWMGERMGEMDGRGRPEGNEMFQHTQTISVRNFHMESTEDDLRRGTKRRDGNLEP